MFVNSSVVNAFIQGSNSTIHKPVQTVSIIIVKQLLILDLLCDFSFCFSLLEFVSPSSSSMQEKETWMVGHFFVCVPIETNFLVCVSKFAFPFCLLVSVLAANNFVMDFALDMVSSWQELLYLELMQSAFCRCLSNLTPPPNRSGQSLKIFISSSFILSEADGR